MNESASGPTAIRLGAGVVQRIQFLSSEGTLARSQRHAAKEDGRITYLGVTHYTSSAYDQLEAVMRQDRASGSPLRTTVQR
jgi:hypothetical protein